MEFTDKFVCTTHHFILIQLNLFDLSVDNEGWWYEHFVT